MYFGNNLQGGTGTQFWEPGTSLPPFDANDIINTNHNVGGGVLCYITSTIAQFIGVFKNTFTAIAHQLDLNKGTSVSLDGSHIDIAVDDYSGILGKMNERKMHIDFTQETIDDGAGNQIREILNYNGKFFVYNGSDIFVVGNTGKIGTNQTTPSVTPLVNTVAVLPIYDQTGAFVGNIPII